MRRNGYQLYQLPGYAILLVAPPIALVRLVGWTGPDTVPSLAQVHAWLQEPLTWSTIVATSTGVGWLMWCVYAATVAAEICRWFTRRWRLPRLSMPRPAQAMTAAVLGATAVSAASHAAQAATGPTDATATVPDRLDNGDRYLIATVNTSAATSSPSRLAPGTGPTDQRPTASVPTAETEKDPTFRSLAGASTPAGMPSAHGRAAAGDGAQQYAVTVQRGDTLWEIAEVWLGDPHRWVEIYDLNKARYDRHGRMRGGDHIESPWVLALPADARPPAGARPAAPVPPISPRAPHTTPPAPVMPPMPSQSPDWQEPDGVVEPPQTAATPTASSTTTADPAARPTAAERPQHSSHDGRGVAIPNGWVTIGLAATLAAAAAMVWLRRRHRYNPHTPPDPATDPTLQPLPATVTRLRREVRRQAPHLLDPPQPGPTVREYAETEPKPTLPEPGPHGPDIAGWGPLPAGGLGLTGPGAAAAARAMLVATLSAGHAFDPDAEATVVVPAGVLADLVGGHALVALIGSIPRLIITPDLSEAVTHLHRESLDRAWIFDQHDAQNLTELRARFPDHEPLPPVLLIADTPEPAKRSGLSTVLDLSHRMGIGAVLLGDWPAGTAVHVESDGSTTGSDGQRLSTLDQQATIDSLAVLREAHTGEPPEQATPAQLPASPTTAESGTADQAPPATTPPAQGHAHAASEPHSDLGDGVAASGTPGPGEIDQTRDPASPGPPAPGTARHGRDLPGATVPVKIRALGTVAILKPDGTAVAGLRRKAAELLLYLAAHRGGAAIDAIKEALWPDAPMSRAKERLATDVANLRASLRAGAGITPPPAALDTAGTRKPARGGKKPAGPEFVLNPGGRYILAPDLVDIDWWRVRDAVAEAATAADTPARQAALERAVAAFGGLLYDADGIYEWANVEVEVSRRLGVTAHAQLAELIGADEPGLAAGYLQTAADLDPINEELAVAAMRAHAAAGDIDAVRARFSRLSRALLDTGQEPAEETSALATQLCRDVAVREPRSRPGDRPRDDKPAAGKNLPG